MKLTPEQLARAYRTFINFDGNSKDSLGAAIEEFIDTLFTPGQVMELPLEAIPQRDYRKELWIAHWAAIDGKTKFEDAVCGTQKALEAFDKFFSEPTHG